MESLDSTLKNLDARVTAIQTKLDERDKEPWYTNALTLSIIGGTLALVSSIVTTSCNNASRRRIEAMHAESTLILEAIKTGGDANATCKNLVFFVNLGLLSNANDSRHSVHGSSGQSQSPSPAHRTPVIFKCGAAQKATLVILTMGAAMRPREAMRAEVSK